MTKPVIPWRNEDSVIFSPEGAANAAGPDPGLSKAGRDAIRAESWGGPSPYPYPIRDPGPLPSDDEDGGGDNDNSNDDEED